MYSTAGEGRFDVWRGGVPPPVHLCTIELLLAWKVICISL